MLVAGAPQHLAQQVQVQQLVVHQPACLPVLSGTHTVVPGSGGNVDPIRAVTAGPSA